MLSQKIACFSIGQEIEKRLSSFNYGVLYMNRCLEVTAYNALVSSLFDVQFPIGQPVLLDAYLARETEGYAALAGLVTAEQECRDKILSWEMHGQTRHVVVDTYRREDENGHFQGLFVFLKDLGNLLSVEQHLQRTDKLATVGKIAAGIAHEIRNPLTTIKGFLQVLESHFSDDASSSELQYVSVMLTEIERVNSLVSELLLLSKPHKVEKKVCSLSAIMTELGPLLESEALLCGMEYVIDMAETPPLYADPALVKQVILNLAKNGFEAMEHGGELRISTCGEGKYVKIEVADSGPGIPYYLVDKVFDAFFTTKEKGTGLGLSICQRIIADHGGEIRVSSKGFGTCFTVLLPAAEGV